MFKPLAFFTCRRHHNALVKFLDAYGSYLNDKNSRTWAALHDAVPEAAEALDQANLTLTSLPSPVMGGAVLNNINVATNVFCDNLFDTGRLTPRLVANTARTGIAFYAKTAAQSRWWLVNPLVWLWSTIEVVLGLPFRLLGAMGFNAGKAEDSPLGKLLKLVLLVLSILVALHQLGWLVPVRDAVLALLGRRQ